MSFPEQKIIALAQQHPEVQVVWLYGSHAKGNAGTYSDIDLAVAFDPVHLANKLETRLRPELLADDWRQQLGLSENGLSILDINQSPIPLAYSVISANRVLWSADKGRQLQEEVRIMSMMELDYQSFSTTHNRGIHDR